MINLFRDINVNTIYYKYGQIEASLAHTIPMIVFFFERKEYDRRT